MKKLKVSVIEDSISIRKAIESLIKKNEGLELLQSGKNGQEAVDIVRTLKPDCIILDIEMPIMNGIEAIKAIKKLPFDCRRCKILVFSAFTEKDAKLTLEALKFGADDFITKPRGHTFSQNQKIIEDELIPRIFALIQGRKPAEKAREKPAAEIAKKPKYPLLVAKREIIAIGLSTGGPQAILKVLPQLPENLSVPVVIVQHMPPMFTKQFALTLDQACKIRVHEAEDGMSMLAGHAYIAKGGFHMTVKKESSTIHINEGPLVQSCRPSVDVLFESVAKEYGKRTVGVVMTGMGRDGADGCLALKKTGAPVITQNQETCVVYGMPKAVNDENLSDHILPLERIAAQILVYAR
ncbi:chemotaxis response regulator protein-glutamate methylesterase [Candidatus Riflebacteria bacterium]